MAEWKSRGYVPDSDDEDESQSAENADIEDAPSSHTDGGEGGANILPRGVDPDSGTRPGIPNDGHNGELQEESFTHSTFEAKRKQTTAAKSRSPTVDVGDEYQAAPALTRADDTDELGQGHYTHYAVVIPPRTYSQSNPAPGILPDNSLENIATPHTPATINSPSSPLSSIPSPVGTVDTDKPRLPSPSVARPSTFVPPNEYDSVAGEISQFQVDNTEAQRASAATERTAKTGLPAAEQSSRSFRRRNPIQLHPYAIEGENYRQILKARGLRPLQIVQGENELRRATAPESQVLYNPNQNGTQVTAEGAGTSTQASPTASSPIRGFRPSPRPLSTLLPGEGEELPDLAALLRAQPVDYDSAGNKRRKIQHEYSKKCHLRADYQNAGVQDTAGYQEENTPNSLFDIPASPPASASSPPLPASPVRKKRFKKPKQPADAGLPSPLTSSEPRRRPLIELLQDDDSGSLETDSEESASADTISDDGSHEPHEEPAKDLRRVSKKIRGVLPASWLKLDLKAQLEKERRRCPSSQDTSPKRSNAQRGIAQIITRPRNRSPHLADQIHIVLSDYDSDSDTASADADSLPELNLGPSERAIDKTGFARDRTISAIDLNGEVEEDNRIDTMLQKSRRHFSKDQRRSKKQAKSSHQSKNKGHSYQGYRMPKKRQTHQPKITDQFDKLAEARSAFRPPDLSVLDAIVCQASEDRSGLPPFLKIASRTARKRVNQGRHSPSHKILKLASHADTNDANKLLQEWREGSIQTLATVNRQLQRQPLQPRSGNELTTQEGSSRIPQKLASTNSATQHVPANPSRRRLQKKQGTIDQVVQDLRLRQDDQRVRKYRFANPLGKPIAVPKQKKVASDLQRNHRPRQALLETPQADYDEARPEGAFSRSLARIDLLSNELQKPDHSQSPSGHGFRPDKYASKSANTHFANSTSSVNVAAADTHLKLYRTRKRRPRRLDIYSSTFRQPSDSEGSITPDQYPSEEYELSLRSQPGLTGFERFNGQFSVIFDVKPLPGGTRFHVDTFLGGGNFLRNITALDAANLDRARGTALLKSSSGDLKWSCWNEEVSSELEFITNDIVQKIKALASLILHREKHSSLPRQCKRVS